MSTIKLNENFDFIKTCRLCLNQNKELISIFDISSFQKQYLIIIGECTGVMMFKNDELPKNICVDCVECLNKFYEFRKLVANSEDRLHDFLNKFANNLINDVKNANEAKTENLVSDFNEESNRITYSIKRGKCLYDLFLEEDSESEDKIEIVENELPTINSEEAQNSENNEKCHQKIDQQNSSFSSHLATFQHVESSKMGLMFENDYDSASVSSLVKKKDSLFYDKSLDTPSSTLNIQGQIIGLSHDSTKRVMNDRSKSLSSLMLSSASPPDYFDADPNCIPFVNDDYICTSKEWTDTKVSSCEIKNEVECLQDEVENINLHSAFSIQIDSNQNFKKHSKFKNYCYFCENVVLNFARHLRRHHFSEFEVQKAFSFPTKSKERADLLTNIRKKGNYLSGNVYKKPIKKSILHTELLPCKDCYGFYSAKSLWRHRKKCATTKDFSAKSEAQSFIAKHLKIDSELREKVFPRMRGDAVSLTAKKDFLICAFGAKYIKMHRKKNFINVASRKMRELAKLLIEIRKLDLTVKNFVDALHPKKFNILIKATKIVSRYDEDKWYYQTPTFALNIGTNIKQCCDIALLYVLKEDENFENVMIDNLKSLIKLIDSSWKFNISAQALNDLNINKWNKITLLSLSSDLKLLNDYLVVKAKNAETNFINLKFTKNDYQVLLETIFCRVLLLNRRPPGELQKILLYTYEMEITNQTYEVIDEVLSPTEKILMTSLKRIMVQDKTGNGVSVLFSNDIRNQLKLLQENRYIYVRNDNLYLFGNPGTMEPICGYQILNKYAKYCGAKNPSAITCTNLRKHIATLTQVFTMTENDLKQLSSFMGYTIDILRHSYDLSNDIYQTAKISKLLMLMEEGRAEQFKEKNLDDIEIYLDDNLVAEDANDQYQEEMDNNECDFLMEKDCNYSNKIIQNEDEIFTLTIKPTVETTGRNHTRKHVIKRIPWTEKQRKLTKSFFATHIKNKKPPKRNECEELIKKYPDVFHNKNWLKIKVFIQNVYTKLTK